MQAFVDWPVGRDEIRIKRVEQIDDVTDLVFGGLPPQAKRCTML